MHTYGVESVRVISVIETKAARVSGAKDQPARIVTEYWSLDGEKLAENDPYWRDTDPYLRAIRSAASKANSDSM